MAEFKVSLEIQLSAENPLEAAKTARQWLIEDPMICVTQNQESGEIHTVDLSEEDEAAVLPANEYNGFIKPIQTEGPGIESEEFKMWKKVYAETNPVEFATFDDKDLYEIFTIR